MIRKEVDNEYSRQYSGCLVNVYENPELGSDSPVELMLPERIWEVPAVPRKPVEMDQNQRRGKVKSLFFDHGVGLWMPKH
jgi:hypothetical protein